MMKSQFTVLQFNLTAVLDIKDHFLSIDDLLLGANYDQLIAILRCMLLWLSLSAFRLLSLISNF